MPSTPTSASKPLTSDSSTDDADGQSDDQATDDQATDDQDEPTFDVSTLKGVFARAKWQRDRTIDMLTKRINSGMYGVGDDNYLRGPADFRIDLDGCPSDWSNTTGITNEDIRIGYTGAQSGVLSAYGQILVGLQNYLDWVNANDPIGSRQIVVDSRDDAYVAQRTIENVNSFIEADDILAITTLGSPNTMATYRIINDACVPQPFVQTGHPAWGDPVHHPWTIGGLFAYNAEAVSVG